MVADSCESLKANREKGECQLCWLSMNGREAEVIWRLYWRCWYTRWPVSLPSIVCKRGNRVIKCQYKTGQSQREDSPVETIRQNQGESWQGWAWVHVRGREVLSHSLSHVSSSLFLVLLPLSLLLCLLLFPALVISFHSLFLNFLFFIISSLFFKVSSNEIALTMLTLSSEGKCVGTIECFLLEQIYHEPNNQCLWLCGLFLGLALLTVIVLLFIMLSVT